MNKEIEAKFLNIDQDDIRRKLSDLGAICEVPMRLMRRVTFENAEMGKRGGWIRVRDEGDKVTVTYKQVTTLTADGVHEIETSVKSFDDMVAILRQIGMSDGSFQESRRETWKLKDVEIVLDEWPWLRPYIEVEGPTEDAIKIVADQHGFDWSSALFGDVMVAYRAEYPHLLDSQTIGTLSEVKFGAPIPGMFKAQKKQNK